jgi:hypothetical protein
MSPPFSYVTTIQLYHHLSAISPPFSCIITLQLYYHPSAISSPFSYVTTLQLCHHPSAISPPFSYIATLKLYHHPSAISHFPHLSSSANLYEDCVLISATSLTVSSSLPLFTLFYLLSDWYPLCGTITPLIYREIQFARHSYLSQPSRNPSNRAHS